MVNYDQHVFSCISCFLWSKFHQKYDKWVLVGCRIEFPIQWVLPIENKSLKSSFFTCLFFYHFNHLLNFFTQKMVIHPLWLTSSPWILLVRIKLIFVVHFCFEAYFYLKISLMNRWVAIDIHQDHKYPNHYFKVAICS